MSAWYTKGRNAFGTGDIDWINDPIIALLICLDYYTPDYDNDTFISDIPSTAIMATANLLGNNIVDRIATTNNLTFPLLDSSLDAGALILAKDTSDINSSPVLLLIDQGVGFPYSGPGEDCIIQWDVNGVFVL